MARNVAFVEKAVRGFSANERPRTGHQVPKEDASQGIPLEVRAKVAEMRANEEKIL